ncbi:hypothetical protein VOLCADRAFT_106190 [Volvox carteri f. nagariensis]|uniref:Uncharacterized protein n=1 Tax=Volvox carteri f. nagariensis TaxID=3068 RepID=D8U5Q4_VOLCA|nr:uncharacterized protein VOLCADRAFT_106190 [Volvox carteri f. nagariensis]EFJ44961.1 hypothetical protein VOLCADRAFT_106190 [Volvox carteri f. nagariensis]|eukprot:XP_002953932.1 hypothetical protein VOLCADRAFT_106190 [Volvox carteri f. nagariensis]
MGSNKVSMAQFEDFPPTNRRHVGAPQDQLGPGLAPRDEAKVIPVSLTRSRVAHDGAELQEDPDSFVSTAGKEAAATSSAAMSSYQAMQAGLPLEQKKRMGKKIVQQQQPIAGGLFFGSALGAAGPRAEPEAALGLGTTKASPHIPGYGGHIPKTATPADAAPVRTMDKSLIIENYKPYGPGYTGRKT